jgi:hypothetical protein
MQTVFAQNTDAKKTQPVPRHASGDNANLTQRQDVEAVKAAK